MQLFERPQKGERAILVNIRFSKDREQEDFAEFYDLATSAGVEPVDSITGARASPDPRYFVGSGKADEIRQAVVASGAEVVLVNHALTPAQERNLERTIKCRILDRTGVILDIFAQRARSFEGKLQVELAQLRYLSSRLVRGWTHLERQKGGIGLRGPGETQLETDRRLIGARIKQLNKRLEKVSKQRSGQRSARTRSSLGTVSLVGYTNAGKSTLFNRVTGAGVVAENQLFATLDPTLRRVEVPGAAPVILADTVGFINHLPHGLVAAFRATLEETERADLLLHVVDASDENRADRIEQVNEVLAEIGAQSVPQIDVYNKCDLLEACVPRLDRDSSGRVQRVWLSAKTGAGMDLLAQALAEFSAEHATKYLKGSEFGASGDYYSHEKLKYRLRISASAGRLRARLYERGLVLNERILTDGDVLIDVEVYPYELNQFLENGCRLEVDTGKKAVA